MTTQWPNKTSCKLYQLLVNISSLLLCNNPLTYQQLKLFFSQWFLYKNQLSYQQLKLFLSQWFLYKKQLSYQQLFICIRSLTSTISVAYQVKVLTTKKNLKNFWNIIRYDMWKSKFFVCCVHRLTFNLYFYFVSKW